MVLGLGLGYREDCESGRPPIVNAFTFRLSPRGPFFARRGCNHTLSNRLALETGLGHGVRSRRSPYKLLL
jgi:hypothetical protein